MQEQSHNWEQLNMTGGRGTSDIKTDYPITEGLTLGTTKLRDERSLDVEDENLISEKERVGI